MCPRRVQTYSSDSHSCLSKNKPSIGPLGKATEQWVDRHLNIHPFTMSTLTIKPHTSTIHTYTEILSPGVEMEMALILGGEFQMGSPENEEERRSNEERHTVTVPTFFMGCTPVTQGQWRSIVQLSQIQTDLEPSPSDFTGDDNLPVENVSWDNAIEFCRLLSEKTGRTYRLPSEAEWEYACRAGTTTPFSFGETIDAELANYRPEDFKKGNTVVHPGKYGQGRLGERRGETTPVKTFSPNPWGLYDMHGNVREWCQDYYESDQSITPTDGVPHSIHSNEKVLRSCSWLDYPENCRSASRFSHPHAPTTYIGFRVVSSASRTLA
jgi:formylglycine-generating enzyme required for sulfatase activity